VIEVKNTTAPLSVKAVYHDLRQYERQRPDLGVGKAVLDRVLEPASPFDRKGARPPQRWFVLCALLAALGFGCFVYFNGPAVSPKNMDNQDNSTVQDLTMGVR
jgi:hypothetical protein